jgi:hypothetical protein
MASAQAAWTATTLLHPACHIGPCQENLWLVSTHWCVRAGQEACMQQLQTVPHKPAGIHCWGVGALLIDASCAMPFLAASNTNVQSRGGHMQAVRAPGMWANGRQGGGTRQACCLLGHTNLHSITTCIHRVMPVWEPSLECSVARSRNPGKEELLRRSCYSEHRFQAQRRVLQSDMPVRIHWLEMRPVTWLDQWWLGCAKQVACNELLNTACTTPFYCSRLLAAIVDVAPRS